MKNKLKVKYGVDPDKDGFYTAAWKIKDYYMKQYAIRCLNAMFEDDVQKEGEEHEKHTVVY